MWCTTHVVRSRVSSIALPATSYPLGSTRKPDKSNRCHRSSTSARNSFVCHPHKTKDFACHTFCKFTPVPPVTANRVPS